MAYWLLTTHLFALFPMGTFLWSWKRRKDQAAIFMLIKFLYLVTYSLLYHQHNELENSRAQITTDADFEKWALLDSYASSSLIFTTVLYGLRVRAPQFYIISFAVENVVLILYLWHELAVLLNAWYLFICSLTVAILKWKTIWRYLLKFKCLSFLTVSSGIIAMAMFLVASEYRYGATYIKYHSLWHCFIFSTAGFTSLLRYNLDEELYPMINRREQLNSI